MTRKTVSLLLLLAALLLAACELPGKATLIESARESGSVRYVNFKVYDPVYLAMDRGLFAARGITVTMLGDVLGGPTAIQAVAAGSAEAGLSSIPALINANAAGLPVIGVADIQSAVAKQPLEHYYVKADSPIKSLADLPGKKFAINLVKSSFHYTALMALEGAKVPEDKVEFVLLPFDQQEEALIRGRVDVIGLIEPYNSHAKATYGAAIRELFNAQTVFGTKQFTLIFVNRVWASYNPKTAAAFTSALADAIAWGKANQRDAARIVSKYTGVEEKYVPDYHFQDGGKVVIEDIAFWIDYLRRRKDLTVDWIKPESIGTNRYNLTLPAPGK